MHFTRLRLHGFKSFVDSTDLHIGTGMTGIVGPNGCGKSNLVEALRWVMGENSAKSMRGGEMDDVIFGGTATRPARNVAEVTLELDNAHRTATAEFNNDDTLLVTRQIERGSGSDYRLNGKPLRRRDVQLLFADQATGAHSTNLVGQGQIDALIRAKPQDRRAILEEASGTSGLHARRHEAELKLKGSEQNLTRVDDVLQNYDTQLRGLKNQIRQASRYRNLADHIRRAEAAVLHLRWEEAERGMDHAKFAFQAADARVGDYIITVTRGTTARTESAATLPPLRQAEAVAAALVQKLTLTREQQDGEAKRLADETKAMETRLAQAQADEARERARLSDGETSIVRLREESEHLTLTQARIAEELPRAEEALAVLAQEVEHLDHALAAEMQETATSEARHQALRTERNQVKSRADQMVLRRDQLETQRAALLAETTQRPDLAMASALVEATETELTKRQTHAHRAEEFYHEAQGLHTQARDLAQKAQTDLTKLKAEEDALASLLQTHDEQSEKVIDLITVTPGLENALAIAVGEALTAALNREAAKYWREMAPLSETPALPSGIVPLSQFVQAPAALARCLSQIGLAENAADGEAATRDLKPGQTLVSRDGWAWRWDGFTLTPEAKTSTALRLQQRNRLNALQEEVKAATQEAESAQKTLADSEHFLAQRKEEDKNEREALKTAFAALNDARNSYARQEKETTALTTKLAGIEETLDPMNADITQLATRLTEIDTEIQTLPALDAARAKIQEARTTLAEQRSHYATQQGECSRLAREQTLAATRAQTVTAELMAWQDRLAHAGTHIEDLTTRMAELTTGLETLRARPAALDTARSELLSELAQAEVKRRAASDALVTAETALAEIEQQVKRDENALTEARETRVRAEAAIQAAQEHFTVLRDRMREKLDCAPEALPQIAELKEDETQDIGTLEQNLARYLREREAMGPVNLLAESEAETLQTQIETLTRDKEDLTAAIAKLRQGIGQLNKEARERLQGAFSLVNERFQVLFQRLFNGGKAYLELLDNEDPMNAGLEIFASPPGKKMQMLTLLSGGERTLTALALLFAVFQTNPSPICVLDEAEAALDESNISRFCDLVESIARETGTRFLVITHQRLTMARMDRLFGVTMGEKGVSQLVSVNLETAVAIRDGAKAAAALAAVQAA